nr:MAG TPA: hypothetical protein [Caudoviricetes sp.]
MSIRKHKHTHTRKITYINNKHLYIHNTHTIDENNYQIAVVYPCVFYRCTKRLYMFSNNGYITIVYIDCIKRLLL